MTLAWFLVSFILGFVVCAWMVAHSLKTRGLLKDGHLLDLRENRECPACGELIDKTECWGCGRTIVLDRPRWREMLGWEVAG